MIRRNQQSASPSAQASSTPRTSSALSCSRSTLLCCTPRRYPEANSLLPAQCALYDVLALDVLTLLQPSPRPLPTFLLEATLPRTLLLQQQSMSRL